MPRPLFHRFPLSKSALTLSLLGVACDLPVALTAQEITIEGTQFVVDGGPLWINGINAAWIDWNDFGGGRFRATQTDPNNRATRGWDEELASYAAAGINAARIWIDCDGTHVLRYDANGFVTGTVPGFIEDVGRLLELGRKHRVYIMPVLTSFDHARQKSWENTWQNWRTLLGDDARIDSYINTVVIPLVRAYPDHPYLFAWEICNEPEWMYAGSAEQRGTTRERVVAFHARVAAAINKNTAKPVTTGTAGWQWMSDRPGFNGQLYSDASLRAAFDDPDARLDFFQIHYYDWMQSQGASPFDEGDTPAYFLQAAPDRPVLIGECPGLRSTNPAGGRIKTVAEMYQAGWDNGYQGVMAWSSSGHDGAGTLPEIAEATRRMRRRYAAEIAPEVPRILAHPAAATLAPGTTGGLTTQVEGPGPFTYQWFKDQSVLPNAIQATLAVTAPGSYHVEVAGARGAKAVSRPATVRIAAPEPGKLRNLSVLARSGLGADVLTAGFVTTGGTKADLVLRAVARRIAAAPFNVPGTLADPVLVAARLDGTELARNDDWPAADAAAMAALGAFALEVGSADAAYVGSLPAGLPVTMQVSDADGGTGVAIAEIYDANPVLTGNRLVNLSARVRAGGAFGALTAGFVIDGNQPRRMLVRAIGPALIPLGLTDALPDPRLRLVDTTAGVTVAENEDWQDWGAGGPLADAFADTGAFVLPAGSLDAALLVTLQPGAYTVVVESADGAAGITLAEVYDLGPAGS